VVCRRRSGGGGRWSVQGRRGIDRHDSGTGGCKAEALGKSGWRGRQEGRARRWLPERRRGSLQTASSLSLFMPPIQTCRACPPDGRPPAALPPRRAVNTCQPLPPFDAAVGHHWMVVLWDWVAGAVRLAADVVGGHTIIFSQHRPARDVPAQRQPPASRATGSWWRRRTAVEVDRLLAAVFSTGLYGGSGPAAAHRRPRPLG